jgi:ATP-dependent DNA helicase
MLQDNDTYKKLLHPDLLEFLSTRGIKDFYPPQLDALEKGLSGKNIVVSIPTASGKTLIAEVLALHKLIQQREIPYNSLDDEKSIIKGKILYLCPLKALASEKYKEFKQNWESLGFRVGVSTSDPDRQDFGVFRNDLIILTNEKADSLLRLNTKIVKEIIMVISDEIHLINDESRGITLEFLLTRVMNLSPNAQIVGLSATISNASELAGWLKADLITSDWRPVQLKEGYYLNEEIVFNDNSIRRVNKERGLTEVEVLTIDMIKEGGQVLVFANSRRSAMSLAEKMAPKIRNKATPEEKKEYLQLQKDFKNLGSADVESSAKLYKMLEGSVAFHHAGINSQQQHFIVDNFNNHKIKVICCTPTLAAGVNTPARRVIIKTLYRYSSEKGSVLIPVMEYKQMAGRAGRPRYDPYGEVVILSSKPKSIEKVAGQYIYGEPEEIYSKLNDESNLQSHILGLIVSKYANSKEAIIEFIGNTFYYYQKVDVANATPKSRESSPKVDLSFLKPVSKRIKSRRKGGRGEDPLGLHKIHENKMNQFTTAEKFYNKNQNKSSKQDGMDEIDYQIEEILNYLLKYEFIEHNDEKLTKTTKINATKFGEITCQLYFTPKDAVIIREDLQYSQALKENNEITLHNVSWLHLATKLSAFFKPFLRKNDYNYIMTFIERYEESFIVEEIPEPFDHNYQSFAQEIKLTMILNNWISEVNEKQIIENFNVGAGDLRRISDTAQWIFRAIKQISSLDLDKNVQLLFENLQLRIYHGIKENLIPLVKLKGIGRVRARKLFQGNFKSLDSIKNATVEELAVIPLIGKDLAKKIIDQASQKKKPKKSTKKPLKRTKTKVVKKTTRTKKNERNQNKNNNNSENKRDYGPDSSGNDIQEKISIQPTQVNSAEKPSSSTLDNFLKKNAKKPSKKAKNMKNKKK